MNFTKTSFYPVLKTNSFNYSIRWAALALVILTLTSGVSLAQGVGRQQLHGHVPAAVSTAPQLEGVSDSQTMDLAIGLPLRNEDELQSLLKDINDPHSPQFRHFLTPDQFTARFGPTEADYQSVIDFAKTHHLQVIRTHSNRVLVQVRGAAGDIKKAFHVNLNYYKKSDGTKFHAPDREPSLDLDTPVLHVSGLDSFNVAHYNVVKKPGSGHRPLKGKQAGIKNNPSPNAGTADQGLYQGLDLRDAYCNGVPASLNGSGQSVGLVEFDGFYQSDLNYYASSSNPPLAQITPTTVLLDGFNGVPSTGGQLEVALDIEMVMALSPGAQIVVYEGNPSDNYQVEADNILAAMAEPPLCNQLSCSWYSFGDETDANLFAQFAAQGQSFFLASGDFGAFGPSDFFSEMPGPGYISPYITTVGGTQLTTTVPVGNPVSLSYVSETTWNDPNNGTSAGGILTNQLAIPSYQTSIPFTAYPSGNGGSTQWRNVPDVSMLADDLLVVAYNYAGGSGYDSGVAGTSAAAPLWAAFTSMVNQQAAAQGRSTVGFINPALTNLGLGSNYNGDFHDINDGSDNDGDGRDATAYHAVTGYDLATGWGTPKGMSLINDLVAGIPVPTATPTGTWYTNTPTFTSTSTFTPTFTKTPTFTFTSTGTIPTATSTPTICPNNYLNWNNMALMPTSRRDLSVASVNGIVYAVGGLRRVGILNTMEAYNPATNSWSEMATMPTARYALAAGGVNGIVYAVGGSVGSSVVVNTLEAFNPSTNSWSTMAPMPTARMWLSAAAVNGILYAIGGQAASGTVNTVEAYNPSTNSWSTMAPMPTARNGMTVGVVNGIIYVAGGYDVNGNTLGTLESYNPATDSWTSLSGMITPRGYTASGVLNGQFYVAAGTTSTGNVNTVESYSPVTNSWTTQNSAPNVCFGQGGAVVNGTLYLVGGNDGLSEYVDMSANEAGALECGFSPTPSFTPTIINTPTMTFTPTGTAPTASPTATFCSSSYLTWSTMASLPTARFELAAGVVNGILYAVGGNDSSGYLNSLEAYNPSTNSWTNRAPMPIARAQLSVGVVNGTLYAVGGFNPSGAMNNLEAYNPATNSWSELPAMPTARAWSNAASVNGILYVIGGYSSSSGALNTVEAYNPATNSWSEMATLPTARYAMAVGVVNGIIYAAGGAGNSGILTTLEAYNPATNSWTTGFPGMATPSAYSGYGVLDGQLYVAAGFMGNNQTNAVEAYNPATNSWSPQASALTARDSLASGVINGNLYLAGGQSFRSGLFANNEAGALICGNSPTFTPTVSPTGTWMTSTPTPVLTATFTPTTCPSNYLNWTAQNPMHVARYGMATAVLNGFLYTVGGENNNGTVNNVEWYNPWANNWTDVAPVPTTRYRLAAGVVNGILYAVGGTNGTTYNTMEAYNPTTNTWATMAPMPTARAGLGVGVINGILYAVGGEYVGGTMTNLEAYNPATNSWSVLAAMPTGRAGMAVGVLNGLLYVAGGISSTGQGYSPLTTLEAYNPATNTWTTGLPGMPTARGFCSGGVLNGQLYAVGGETNLGFTEVLGTVESYNPSTNSWTTQSSAPTGVNGSAAGVINEALYVVGGTDINNNPLTLNQVGALVCGFSPTPTKTATLTLTPTFTLTPTLTPTASPTPTPGYINILSISPACAPIGGAVTIVWSWTGNTSNGNVDYVVGFGASGTPGCAGVVWASPYACNGASNGVLNPTNAGSSSTGTTTTVVQVPAGAPSGDILLGYALSCGTVQFTAANSNCGGINNWAASAFSICTAGTSTPTVTNTPTSTFTATAVNSATSTNTVTNTFSPTASLTPTATYSNTVSSTFTSTPTVTRTNTFTPVLTATATNSATLTLTASYTNTATATPTLTTTNSPTATGTSTLSPTASYTSTATWTKTLTPVPPTPSPTKTATLTYTSTPVPPTATYTKTFTPVLSTLTPTATPTSSSVCAGVPAWNGNFVAYTVGVKVTYNNELYQCIEAHTSEPNWMPPVVPALWKDLGSCGAAPAMAISSSVIKTAVAGPNISKNLQPVKFFVQLNAPAQVVVDIFTPMGQLVASSSFYGNPGMNNWMWDIHNASKQIVSSGLYIYTIHVTSNGNVETKTGKIVIMH